MIILKIFKKYGAAEMRILYKYKAFDDVSDPENKKYTNNIILNSSLYFSASKKFNDPFDCRLSFRQKYSLEEITSRFEQMANNSPHKFTLQNLQETYPDNDRFVTLGNECINDLVNTMGVLSLCTNPHSILMWSHYSNDHTGLVFQFRFEEESSTCFTPYYKVGYKDEYDLLSYSSDFKEEARNLMLTKHTSWQYESEIRMIDFELQGEKKFKKHELTSIIFGVLAKNDDIVRMINLCKENGFEHVKFSQAMITPGKFSLEFCERLIE